jgi:DNA-binding CsgD family transcriptional regulator
MTARTIRTLQISWIFLAIMSAAFLLVAIHTLLFTDRSASAYVATSLALNALSYATRLDLRWHRLAKALKERTPTPAVGYCPHDEGEPCHCPVALHIATAARKPAATDRQATVWQLTQQGRTAPQIAEQLGITQRNVERLRQRARLHQEAG